MTRTDELAVMCDTFRPLKLTTLARDLDDPSYAYSWYKDPCVREFTWVDGERTIHFGPVAVEQLGGPATRC